LNLRVANGKMGLGVRNPCWIPGCVACCCDKNAVVARDSKVLKDVFPDRAIRSEVLKWNSVAGAGVAEGIERSNRVQ
jgi:hypothetical protein